MALRTFLLPVVPTNACRKGSLGSDWGQDVLMTKGFKCKSFSVGLPDAAADQSLTALFRHVSNVLAEDDPISMDDIITVSFYTELGQDSVYRGGFTVVFNDDDSDTPTA